MNAPIASAPITIAPVAADAPATIRTQAHAAGLVTEALTPLTIADEHLPMLIRATANMVSHTGSRMVQTTHGFGVNDWRVLAAIAVKPGVRAAQLTQPLDLDKAALSRSITLLSDRGWVATVRPSPQARHLFLTPAGKQVYNELLPLALERQELLLTGLDADERAQLVQLLYRVLANEPRLVAHLETLTTA